MTAIGTVTHTVTNRWADRLAGTDVLVYAADPDDVSWSSFELEIPSDVLDAWVTYIEIQTFGATAVHEVDPLSLRECFTATLLTLGGKSGQVHVSEPIMGLAGATDTVHQDWVSCIKGLRLHVTRDDLIAILAPPAEDNAADTGQYEARVTMEEITYSKR